MYIFQSLLSHESWDQRLWSLFFMQSIVDLFTFSCQRVKSAMPLFLIKSILVVFRFNIP